MPESSYSHACNRMRVVAATITKPIVFAVLFRSLEYSESHDLPQRVTKTHATGNDFVVYLDKSANSSLPPMRSDSCATVTSIGGDGLIRLTA